MPRTRLDRYSAPKRPAIDRPKSLILERVNALGKSAEDMAQALGISKNTWFARLRQPTERWPLGQILKACQYLGVEPEDLRAAIRYSV